MKRKALALLLYGLLLADKERWSDVSVAVELAFAGKGLTSPGKVHLLQGITHHNLCKLARAQSSFEHAMFFVDSRDQAHRWISHVSASWMPATDYATWAYSSR